MAEKFLNCPDIIAVFKERIGSLYINALYLLLRSHNYGPALERKIADILFKDFLFGRT
jgi:hypothetical protein